VKKIIVSLIYFWTLSTSLVYSQTIEVDCQSTPLNELLVEWRDKYDLQFSFNDAHLSQYKLSIKQSFATIDEALKAALKGLPLDYEKNDDVYIIYPSKKEKKPKDYTFVGKIIERGTDEPLPFSHIKANNQQAVTDIKGMFSFNFKDDSIYQVTASHLGCYLLDTTLVAGNNHIITLTPSAVGIKEVIITNNIVEKSTQIGESSGLTSLNHHIANYLPGNGDNSVFNLLRLQPGILAAGEQPNDLIIWGSPEGTSRVTFDEFTIWGLKNFKDNISAVNPYMAKNIEIHKGGYYATKEDVIGGIVNISGKSGNVNQAGLNLFINNETLNGMVELPINRKSAFMLAFRQTYYNLFGTEDIDYIDKLEETSFNVNARPDYDFRDFNLKYSLQGDNGDLFYVSILNGSDEFELNIDRDIFNDLNGNPLSFHIQTQTIEENIQWGGTMFYGKTWANGNSSSLITSYSSLQSDYYHTREVSRLNRKISRIRKDDDAQNDVSKLNVKWENKLLAGEKHTFTGGIEWINNDLVLIEDTFDIEYINLSERANRINLYLQDQMAITPQLNLMAGLRYGHSFFSNDIYLDPRFSVSYRASGNLKLNASWGKYHQFLVKSSIEDENGNYRYSWTLADGGEIPVLKSTHYVVGGAYTRQDLIVNIDAYFKQNSGITRFIKNKQNELLFYGDGRSYGIDVYLKKDFKGHSIWTSYSLGKSEELYPKLFHDNEYRRAYHDQRHEIKLAGLLNLGAFHLSASYIYGSGFPVFSNYYKQEATDTPYNRLDGSLVYRLSSQKFTGEVGISVLNITNADNIKYNKFSRVPLEQINDLIINSDAVPFTPLLYLKLHF